MLSKMLRFKQLVNYVQKYMVTRVEKTENKEVKISKQVPRGDYSKVNTNKYEPYEQLKLDL